MATITTDDIIKSLSEDLKIEDAEISVMLDSFISNVGEFLTEGETVSLPPLGEFSTQLIEEQESTNQSTGKRILTPPRIEVKFNSDTID